MVLPPSSADDASGQDTPGWLRRLRVALRLSRAGLLVLIDHARLERLGELVRALVPLAPEVEVHTEATRLLEVPPGSTVVLVPRVEDADWLNLNRPIFASHALRVVLFCTREVSVALSQRAVDFFDWVSLRLDCPPGPAPYAVAGLRCALAARVPGIVWTGGDLEATFAAARPGRRLLHVSAARPYEELVTAVQSSRGDWLAWTEVSDGFRLRRVRWALAEARCRTRAILVTPDARSPGWWEVHARVAAPGEAREHLARTGASAPGRLAALANLEPEVIELLARLLEQGCAEQSLSEELSASTDPGAPIARRAVSQGLLSEKDVVRGRAPPAALRAFSSDRGGLRSVHESGLSAFEQRLSLQEEALDVEDVAWWSAWTRAPIDFSQQERHGLWSELAEPQLRCVPRTGPSWATAAHIALVGGDLDVAYTWARRAMEADPSEWQVLASTLHAQGRLSEAEALFRERLPATEAMSDAAQGWFFHELGRINFELGQYPAAEEFLRRALASTEKVLGPRHPNHAASLHELASVLVNQGRFSEAEGLLRQSLDITEETLGAQHPNHGASLHELARIFDQQGRYAEAEKLLRQALSIAEKTSGPDSHPYAVSLHELAHVLSEQGKYAEAEKLARQSLAIREQSRGAQHPSDAASLHLLAHVLDKQGRYSEAEPLLRQSLVITEQTHGPRHPGYASSLHELARVLRKQGQLTKAEEFLRQSLVLKDATLGRRHPNYVASLHALAHVLMDQGRYTEAEQLLHEAIAILEDGLDSLRPLLCVTLANLGQLLLNQGRPQESELLLQRAVRIARGIYGEHHSETAQVLSLLATTQAALKKKPEAVVTARQALDDLLQSLGAEHPVTKRHLPELQRILAGK